MSFRFSIGDVHPDMAAINRQDPSLSIHLNGMLAGKILPKVFRITNKPFYKWFIHLPRSTETGCDWMKLKIPFETVEEAREYALKNEERILRVGIWLQDDEENHQYDEVPEYQNFYRCPDCDTDWNDVWDSMCDDECPYCGSKDIEPYKSVNNKTGKELKFSRS